MTKCSKCKADIGFFGKSYSCDECDYTVCEGCISQLSDCKDCDGAYCSQHIKNHECGENSNDEESTSNVVERVQKMDEKQLLRMLVYLKYDSDIETLFDDHDQMIDTVMEKK